MTVRLSAPNASLYMMKLQVSKAVKLKKAKTIIVAPNIEQIESEGGLDDLLTEIMKQAEIAEIPIVFALSRKKLGQVSAKFGPHPLIHWQKALR